MKFGSLIVLGCLVIVSAPRSAFTQVSSDEVRSGLASSEADLATAANRIDEIRDAAVDYLRNVAQSDDGSFGDRSRIGITAVVTAGLLGSGVPAEDPMVAKALEFLLAFQQEDGGFYSLESNHTNYETCLIIMALTKANENGKYDELLAGAEAYVKKMQWDETEGKSRDDLEYGGAGYGSKSRPDMSNTAFLIETLNSLGRGKEDPAIQKALLFVSRCQNLESSYNESPFAALIDDGGFYYTVAAGGESKTTPAQEPNGGLRSYGSMTYAGLKSMIFAGVERDDERVQAAVKYLYSNYSVDENPQMGQSGLYYYYQTMAKAFAALGEERFATSEGEVDWRSNLIDAIESRQQADGSWVNSDARWLEGDPILVTGYMLLTLGSLKDSLR